MENPAREIRNVVKIGIVRNAIGGAGTDTVDERLSADVSNNRR